MILAIGYFIIVIGVLAQNEPVKPSFRVVAPQVICPKDEDGTTHGIPDTTTIMIQTRGGMRLQMLWNVSWTPLEAPNQRLTLLLWRSVRELQSALNRDPPERYLYIIDNTKLLPDVDYIFNVAGVMGTEMISQKYFHINNMSGKRKLELNEGHSDKVSLALLGSEVTYTNIEYTVVAEVTICIPSHDYSFIWTISDIETGHVVNNTVTGSRLVVPAGRFQAGATYDVTCEVIRSSDGAFLNQMRLEVNVLRRRMEVALNFDYIVISTRMPFTAHASVFNHDYLLEDFHYHWWCIGLCDSFKSSDANILQLPGFPEAATYEIGVSVCIGDELRNASMFVNTVDARLPVLQVNPIRRVLNEDVTAALEGFASNIAPTCTLAWYYDTNLNNSTGASNGSQHGVLVSKILTINSLEENFLHELTDYTNGTVQRPLSADIPGRGGRARLVAACGCSVSFSCEAEGEAYIDVNFDLNHRPKVGKLAVLPAIGTGMTTLFTLRTQTATDQHHPLKYSFYARMGSNTSLLLETFLEHVALETTLPYINGTTEVWVEVCDAMGACSDSEAVAVQVTKGPIPASTLIDAARAHCKRCELLALHRLATSALATYQNSGKVIECVEFSFEMSKVLSTHVAPECQNMHQKQYTELVEDIKITNLKPY